MKLKTLETMWS